MEHTILKAVLGLTSRGLTVRFESTAEGNLKAIVQNGGILGVRIFFRPKDDGDFEWGRLVTWLESEAADQVEA